MCLLKRAEQASNVKLRGYLFNVERVACPGSNKSTNTCPTCVNFILKYVNKAIIRALLTWIICVGQNVHNRICQEIKLPSLPSSHYYLTRAQLFSPVTDVASEHLGEAVAPEEAA